MKDLRQKLNDLDIDDSHLKDKAKLTGFDQASSRRRRADFKPEVFFCGQIVGADEFETTDGLFVEVILKHVAGWKLIDENVEDNTI